MQNVHHRVRRVTGAFRRSLVPAVVAAAGLGVASAALAADPAVSQATTSASATNNLVFGIYPGGAAGGASGWAPDNVANDLAAVQQLDSSGAPFMVHLYAEYYGPGSYTAAQEIGSEVQTFAQAGIQVELVLCYRPTDEVPSTDVPGFVTWTQSALSALGKNLSYVQVTNEANVSGSSSSNDGYFPGAKNALVQGVEGAKSYITSKGLSTKVGFNWSYDSSAAGPAWWSSLKTLGGSTFAGDLDWVGVDTYPGTWQQLPTTMSFGNGVAQVTTQALQSTRSDMALAGLGAGVPIHVAEVGYPTGPNRTYAMQQTALASAAQAVLGASVTDNVTAMEFFDLRDAITNSTDFNDQYGLMTDTWTPKPAFTDYQQLVSQYGGAPAAATGTTTTGSTTTTGTTTTTTGSTTTTTPTTTTTTTPTTTITTTPTTTTASSPTTTTTTTTSPTTTTPTTPTTSTTTTTPTTPVTKTKPPKKATAKKTANAKRSTSAQARKRPRRPKHAHPRRRHHAKR
jgi:hypothetical protein